MRRSAMLFVALSVLTGLIPHAGAGVDPAVNIAINGLSYSPPAVIASDYATDFNWQNNTAEPHSATADLAFGAIPFFDTGPIPASNLDTLEVSTAGTFSYHCVFHAMSGKVTQQLNIPDTGVVGSAFDIDFSTGLPGGFSVDVQVKKPGKRKYKTIADDVPGTSHPFTASRAGRYKFRVRVNSDGGGSSAFSPPAVVRFIVT